MQDICHFTFRDIGYYVQYVCLLSGIWDIRKTNCGDICQFTMVFSKDIGHASNINFMVTVYSTVVLPFIWNTVFRQ